MIIFEKKQTNWTTGIIVILGAFIRSLNWSFSLVTSLCEVMCDVMCETQQHVYIHLHVSQHVYICRYLRALKLCSIMTVLRWTPSLSILEANPALTQSLVSPDQTPSQLLQELAASRLSHRTVWAPGPAGRWSELHVSAASWSGSCSSETASAQRLRACSEPRSRRRRWKVSSASPWRRTVPRPPCLLLWLTRKGKMKPSTKIVYSSRMEAPSESEARLKQCVYQTPPHFCILFIIYLYFYLFWVHVLYYD